MVMEPVLTELRGSGFMSSSKPDWGSFFVVVVVDDVATKQDTMLLSEMTNTHWVNAHTSYKCWGNR